MHEIIAIGLLILGIVILFSVDSLIDKTTSNSTLKTIYDNKNIVGAVCVATAYYIYCISQNEHYIPETTLQVPPRIEHVGELPSYDESLGTTDALNL